MSIVGVSNNISVERICESAELSSIGAAWDELIDERSPGAVFRSAAWLLPWWEHFCLGKELCTYAARTDTRLVGLLPAYHVRTVLGSKRLRLMGDGNVASDHLGVIAKPCDAAEASDAIARALVHDQSDLALDGVAAEDPLISALERQAGAAGAMFLRQDLTVCPLLRVPVDRTFSEWLRTRPGGSGAHLRRQQRRLERRSGYRVDILTSERDITEGLSTLWHLHLARWAPSGGSGFLANEALERFHFYTARELARRGWARLYILYASGAPRAALYGFGRGGRFAYYQSGSDPSWARWSVGTAVLARAIEDAFDHHLDEFDFLRGDEAYKRLFASSQRRLLRLRLVRGGRAYALWVADQAGASARRLVRRTLPKATLEHLRRFRRAADRNKRWLGL